MDELEQYLKQNNIDYVPNVSSSRVVLVNNIETNAMKALLLYFLNDRNYKIELLRSCLVISKA